MEALDSHMFHMMTRHEPHITYSGVCVHMHLWNCYSLITDCQSYFKRNHIIFTSVGIHYGILNGDMNRDSTVKWLAAGWITGLRFPTGTETFLLTTTFRTALEPTQPRIQLVQGLKRPVREADYSPQPSVEVVNAWSLTPTPSRMVRSCLWF